MLECELIQRRREDEQGMAECEPEGGAAGDGRARTCPMAEHDLSEFLSNPSNEMWCEVTLLSSATPSSHSCQYLAAKPPAKSRSLGEFARRFHA
jgi:hypothetical protein